MKPLFILLLSATLFTQAYAQINQPRDPVPEKSRQLLGRDDWGTVVPWPGCSIYRIQRNRREGQKGEVYEIASMKADGVYHGACAQWGRTELDGKLYLMAQGCYSNSLAEGLWTNFYESGRIRSVTYYQDGQENGLQTVIAENGVRVLELSKKNDKREGPSFQWDDSGHLLKFTEFRSDSPTGWMIGWHTNGIRAFEGQVDGERDFQGGHIRQLNYIGQWIEWDEKGQVKSQGSYTNGLKDGAWVFMNDSGQRVVGNFSQGKRNGSYQVFNSFGRLISQAEYRNGQRIGKETVWDDSGRIKMEITGEDRVGADMHDEGEPTSFEEVGGHFWGQIKNYGINGKLVNTIFYENGKKVKETRPEETAPTSQ
jgi:antitoxin component YwqK of YwqJK toxin-antitoxin module